MNIQIGVRWDGKEQNKLFEEAKNKGLIDYIELSTPLTNGEEPFFLGLPIYAHSTENPIASAYDLNESVMNMVKDAADRYNSPWVGEHLCMLAPAESGSVGYVINPICDDEFKTVAVENTKKLQNFYKRPVAIELGPSYNLLGTYEDEIDFINAVAEEADSKILIDLSHLVVSNKNLSRPDTYGFDKVIANRVIEIHITGIRESGSKGVWHDDHGTAPSQELYLILKEFLPRYKNLKAITLEVDEREEDKNFFNALEILKEAVRG